jgi:uncharacterized protein YlxW (UPF0749 family)
MTDIKKLEGTVSVNGNVTPTTREPIQQVDSSQWEHMTVAQLYDQRITLYNRIIAASQTGHAEMVNQLTAGLNQLDRLITQKGATGEGIRFP